MYVSIGLRNFPAPSRMAKEVRLQGGGGCAVFQRFAQEAAHEKAGWMGHCIGAGLAVPAGRAGRGSLCFRPTARTSAPATAEECRAAAKALGLPYVEESALTPLLPEGLSLERRQLRMDAPRAGKTVGYALEFAASQEGSACAAARVSVYAPDAKGGVAAFQGSHGNDTEEALSSPFGEVRALEACGAPDGFGGAAGASLLYSLRTEGGLFEVRFTMDGLYTAQVRADAAEQALQILAVLAAQSPESRG